MPSETNKIVKPDSPSINIRKLAYDLYKTDYMRNIPYHDRLTAIKDYHCHCTDFMSFDDYLVKHGYATAKESYHSYDDFITDIYFDNDDYIEILLDDNELIKLYQNDIHKLNDNLPEKDEIQSLIRHAFKRLVAIKRQLNEHGKPSDLVDYGQIYGEYNTWVSILNMLKIPHDFKSESM